MKGHVNKILVICAHTGDFLWRCGGLSEKALITGADVKIVDLTFSYFTILCQSKTGRASGVKAGARNLVSFGPIVAGQNL